MPQYPDPPPPSWRHLAVDGAAAARVLDLDSAVSHFALLAGDPSPVPSPSQKDAISDLRTAIADLDAAGVLDDAGIPAVFVCPISLDPMSDPVTLCTGQTYERANIARWLALGHRTCPTTMQELWDSALTPNATLRQLIAAWVARHRKRSADAAGRAASLVAALRSESAPLKGQPRLNALRELRRLPPQPLFAAAAHGLAASLLGPLTSHAVGSEAVAVLAVVLPLLDRAADPTIGSLLHPAKISLLIDMVNEGALATKLHCLLLLRFLMDHRNFRPGMLASLTLIACLMRLIRDGRNPDGVFAALSMLSALSKHSQVATLIATGMAALPQLVEQLPALRPECVEPALEILDSVGSTPEGCAALKGCPRVIPNVVRLLMRVSEACTRLALNVLCAVRTVTPAEFTPAAVEAGLAAKLLLVIQSGCGPELKQQASELLKQCSLNYTATTFISKCKLTRTIL